MRFILFLSAISSLFMLSACAKEDPEMIKSPCAGIEGSPCGDLRPVNDHMFVIS